MARDPFTRRPGHPNCRSSNSPSASNPAPTASCRAGSRSHSGDVGDSLHGRVGGRLRRVRPLAHAKFGTRILRNHQTLLYEKRPPSTCPEPSANRTTRNSIRPTPTARPIPAASCRARPSARAGACSHRTPAMPIDPSAYQGAALGTPPTVPVSESIASADARRGMVLRHALALRHATLAVTPTSPSAPNSATTRTGPR